ncbi:MAG: histidinol dehydrogenase [Desulfobacteraceae bacterium 4572_35.1]|nr:MAG: histidinol dehydrogenase [Desulfobacteraceae bacterium 4572_35.1]
MIKLLRFGSSDFDAAFELIEHRAAQIPADIDETVRNIIDDVRKRGDMAVHEYTQRFDHLDLTTQRMEVSSAEIEQALSSVSDDDLDALKLAAGRIGAYHRRQKQETWLSTDEDDIMLGQLIRPLKRVGIYVPGGKAAYPSSVLMNAVPAKVAGVDELIMVVPMPNGEANAHVLAAAHIAGVDRIFRIGGAQAIAAMAYGTATVPRVDKITGPGNIFVATAKKMVFGQVDIDMIAGPSEILIVNDGSGNPRHLAADLLSQAEHDELASAVLVTTSEKMAFAVQTEVEKQLELLPRAAIARSSIDNYGAIIVAQQLEQAVDLCNRIATEHLELALDDPFDLLPQIHNAGAIFMGHHTPEALGDYLAGPNHTLPTGGTARFFSPLSLDDFVKKSSLIRCSAAGLKRLGPQTVQIAKLEGLDAHARSVSHRLEDV